ncbi:MAG: fumarylacetoacetate hydrolase family protein [Sphingomicrobium sp.]
MSGETEAIATRFLAARRSAGQLAFYPGEFPQGLSAAYDVQDHAIATLGKPVLGWKVGRIGEPFDREHEADRLAGPIFEVTEYNGQVPAMPVFARGFAAAEAEFLLRLGRAPAAGKRSFTLNEAADLIDAVHVGIEIASSPLRSINDLGPVAIVSDFGNNNGLLVGPAIVDWQSSGFEEWHVTTSVDGVEVGSGRAADFPDGVVGSARFLLELMAARGISLKAGQWISSGAVTGVHAVRPGQDVEARFADDLVVPCDLVAAAPAVNFKPA